jgi:hypothetical protein
MIHKKMETIKFFIHYGQVPRRAIVGYKAWEQTYELGKRRYEETTRCHNPEDYNHHNHHYKNLKLITVKLSICIINSAPLHDDMWKSGGTDPCIHDLSTTRGGAGIATGYGLDGRGVGVRVPVESPIFSSPRCPSRFCGPVNLISSGYRG